jgi:chitodextrinase
VVVEYLKLSGNGQIAVSWQFVPAQPPTAIINGPSQGVAGQPLTFSAANSTAATGRRIVRHEWRFGDGSGAEGIQVDKTYTAAGSFDVTLVVTDDAGLTGVAVQQVAIAAPTATPTPITPPQAIISGPPQAVAGVAVTFDGSSSTPVGGLSSYQWNFGDGGAATGATVSHAFAQAGVYNVTLLVGNAAGQTSQAALAVQVSAPPPVSLPLEGTRWTLQDTLPGTALTALLQQGQISGSGGCNTYSGSFTTFGSDITIGALSVTSFACDPTIMEQENTYLAQLQLAAAYQIDGNQLRLSGQIGDESFRLVYSGARP